MAISTQGTILKVGSVASPQVLTTIGEVVDISGSHEGIFHPPHVQKLAEILRHKLNQLSQEDQAMPAPEALIP